MTKIITILFLLWGITISNAQTSSLSTKLTKVIESPRYLRIMFYNCENYFDIIDDSLTNDAEYLIGGDKNWTKFRFYQKATNISKVITTVGGWECPDIVGLSEVENINTLNHLVYNSPLYNFEYKILHKESPDKRGIDVALLYQSKKYKPIETKFIKVYNKKIGLTNTRDILYSKGTTKQNDTLHIFINHWPSRWGGQLESENRRVYAASILRKAVDSIFKKNKSANIIIMGDLNDYTTNKSVVKVLNAKKDTSNIQTNALYNLTAILSDKQKGSHKYQGKWGILDQIIVSGNLLSKSSTIYTTPDDAHILNAPFLLEKDKTYLGDKPFRTYAGFKYLGGFSDHLPVFIDLNK